MINNSSFGIIIESIRAERWYLPLGVLVHVRVRLHRIFFDEELDALIKRRRHRRRLFTQQNFHGIIACQTHYVIGAARMGATLAIWTICHTIYTQNIIIYANIRKNKFFKTKNVFLLTVIIINIIITTLFQRYTAIWTCPAQNTDAEVRAILGGTLSMTRATILASGCGKRKQNNHKSECNSPGQAENKTLKNVRIKL